MNVRLLSVLSIALGFALACGGGGETPPPPPPPDAAPADGSIGVPECDDYLKKVDECLGKLDAASKSAFESSSKQMSDAWRQAAATPQGKAGLASGCKMALDSFQCPAMPATGTPGAPGTPTDGTAPADGTAPTGTAPADGTAPAGGTGGGSGASGTTSTPTNAVGQPVRPPREGVKAPPRDARAPSRDNDRDGKRDGKRDRDN